VGPELLRLNPASFAPAVRQEAQSIWPAAGDLIRPQVEGGRRAGQAGAKPGRTGHGGHARVVAVQDSQTAGAERFQQEGFFGGALVKIAEGCRVGASDGKDDRDIRSKGAGKPPHVSGLADSDLHHGEAVPRPHAQDVQRQHKAVVLVAERAKRSGTGGQDVREQFLGGGLSNAARDGDERCAKEQPAPQGGRDEQ